MAETHVLFALKRRYARTLGVLRHEPAAAADLAHLAAVIRMFSPDEDLAAIRPIRIYPANRRRWLRHVLAVLRTANRPLGGREIARRVLAAQGLPETRTYLLSISSGLPTTLSKYVADELVKVEGKPRRWAMTKRAA